MTVYEALDIVSQGFVDSDEGLLRYAQFLLHLIRSYQSPP